MPGSGEEESMDLESEGERFDVAGAVGAGGTTLPWSIGGGSEKRGTTQDRSICGTQRDQLKCQFKSSRYLCWSVGVSPCVLHLEMKGKFLSCLDFILYARRHFIQRHLFSL